MNIPSEVLLRPPFWPPSSHSCNTKWTFSIISMLLELSYGYLSFWKWRRLLVEKNLTTIKGRWRQCYFFVCLKRKKISHVYIPEQKGTFFLFSGSIISKIQVCLRRERCQGEFFFLNLRYFFLLIFSPNLCLICRLPYPITSSWDVWPGIENRAT